MPVSKGWHTVPGWAGTLGEEDEPNETSPRPCPKLQYVPQIVPWRFNGQGSLVTLTLAQSWAESKGPFLLSYTNGLCIF